MRRIWLAAMAALLATGAPALALDRLKVAIGGVRGVGESFPADLGKEAGFYARHGIEIETFNTDSTGDTIQALVSGAADLGVAVGFTGVMGPFSKGAPLRVIGATFTGGSQLYWYVRADSPIHSVKDAEGKTVAYSSTGSSAQTSVLALLKYSGVKFKPVATGASPATYAAVMSGQVDVGWAGAPFGLEQVEKGAIRVVWKANAAPDLDKQTLRVLVANAEDLAKRPDVFKRFVAAYDETLDWVYNTPEGLKAYAKWASLSEPAARHALAEFLPRAALDTHRIIGVDDALNDAVAFKYTARKLTPEQVETLIQIPK